MYQKLIVALFAVAVASSAQAQRVDNTPPFDPTAPQLLTGDLNGDGKRDVVLYGSAAYFALGTGTANFSQWTPIAGAPPGGVAALADVNGDGLMDFAVAWSSGIDVHVSVFAGGMIGGVFNFGAGTTTTRPRTSSALSIAVQQILAGDLDGDGRPDLAVRELHQFSSSSEFLILRWMNEQDGFPASAIRSLPEPNGEKMLALADANGDGALDIFSSTHTTRRVRVYHGDGAGHFEAQFGTLTAGQTPGFGIGEVNGDGLLDVVTFSLPATLTAHYGVTGGFNPAALPLPPLEYIVGIAIGDVNGDGRNDIVSVGYESLANLQTPVLVVCRNLGGGDFAVGSPLPLPASFQYLPPIAAADVNGDGWSDVLALTHFATPAAETLTVYLLGSPSNPVTANAGADVVSPLGPYLTATFTLTGTATGGVPPITSWWSSGTTTIANGTTTTQTAGVGLHEFTFTARDAVGNISSDTVSVSAELIAGGVGQQGPIGPQGPAGAQGPAGPQGPAGTAGDAAVSGSILLVVTGTPPPAGYVYLGTFKQTLPRGSGPATSVTLDVYQKP